jgi:hypothetical protein
VPPGAQELAMRAGIDGRHDLDILLSFELSGDRVRENTFLIHHKHGNRHAREPRPPWD